MSTDLWHYDPLFIWKPGAPVCVQKPRPVVEPWRLSPLGKRGGRLFYFWQHEDFLPLPGPQLILRAQPTLCRGF